MLLLHCASAASRLKGIRWGEGYPYDGHRDMICRGGVVDRQPALTTRVEGAISAALQRHRILDGGRGWGTHFLKPPEYLETAVYGKTKKLTTVLWAIYRSHAVF